MEYCSYAEGMFSADKAPPPSMADMLYERLAACTHEAGHAVAGHLLGQGCSYIKISVRYRRDLDGVADGFAYTGCAQSSRSIGRRLNKDLKIGDFSPALAVDGIVTSAGPAAERRFRLDTGLPLRLVDATIGDHDRISTVARRLAENGRSGLAYCRMVWWLSQKLVSNATFWDCVAEIADCLNAGLELEEDHTDTDFVVPGPTARAMMNRHGCGPNFRDKLLREIVAYKG